MGINGILNWVKHKGVWQVLFAIAMLFDRASAQTLYIMGKVTDARSNANLEGVSVSIKGSKYLTSTNANGEFTVETNATLPVTLEFIYVGYTKQELLISSPDYVEVALEESITELSEVLVLSGYTAQKKSEFSGAVSTISSRQLQFRPSVSFDQLLGSQVPGIDVIAPTNVLNNTPVMRIRGINSITSGIFPLVVVDGVTAFVGAIGGAIGNNPLADINPSDIESINILKDASAAALYGSRAANGVMVITTKRGKRGRVKVNYDSWLSRSTPFNLPELLNAEQYTMIKNEAMRNSGLQPGYFLSYHPDGSIVNTNWYDVAYRPGYSHSHNLSFSGANNSTHYYFSMAYNHQNSFIRYNSFERYSARLNIDNQLNEFVKLGAQVGYTNSFNIGPITGAVPSNTLSSTAYNSQYITNEPVARMTYVLPPNVPVYRADGTYSIQNKVSVGYGNNLPSIGTINAYNLAMVQKLDLSTSENNTVLGNAFGELHLLKGLKIKTLFGLHKLLVENKQFLNPIHGGGASANGVATNIQSKFYRWQWVNTANYECKAGADHSFALLLGSEMIKTLLDSWGAQRSNITDTYYQNYQGGFVNISPIGNVYSENSLLSYFSNINYDFRKRYLMSINFRRDGLSALAKGNQWGNFGGASVGWNISNENFYKSLNIQHVIDNVLLRASYGKVGNSEIGDYPSIGAYNSFTYAGFPTLSFSQAANPNLRWETSTKLDIGINFTLFDNRVAFEFDYYNNQIDGLILKSPQSLSAGIPNNFINENVGSMYNRGVELGINGLIYKSADFSWEMNFNFSTLTNKVTELVSDVYVPSIFGVHNMTREGYSIGSIWAVPTKGVNPDNGLMVFINHEGREVQYNHIGSPRWTYLDGTPAPAIDNYRDGRIQGPSLPKYFAGTTHTFKFKNIDLSLLISYVGGNLLYNGTRATNSDQRYFNNGTFILNRWQKPGDKTEIQKLYYGDNVSSGFSFSATSKVEKGDYLKLRNLTLGYHFPITTSRFAKRLSSVYAYLQGQNVVTFTKYRGSDPEVSINGNSIHGGKDQNVPPNAQIVTLGLNVGF